MANRDATGFRAADGRLPVDREWDIDSSNGTNVFIGDVVSVNAAGSVRPASAGDGSIVIGVVAALYDSNGVPVGHPSSSVSTPYLPSSTAGKALIEAALPGRRFIAQGQSGQTLAATDVFATTDHVAGSGNTTFGFSGHELNLSDLNTGGQFLILGKVPAANNAYGTNTALHVVFNESIWAGNGKSVGV